MTCRLSPSREQVLDGGNIRREVWADKGYVDGEREQRLGQAGWRLYIQRKGQPGNGMPRAAQPAHPAPVSRCVRRLGADGRQDAALDRLGTGEAAPELEGRAYNLRRRCSLTEMGAPRPF